MGKSVFGAFWGFGQKALRREEESTLCFLREFCAMRKTSPPVTALPLSHCSSSARVLSCGRLLRRIRAHTFVCLTESAAAAWGKQKSPGWPLPSASYRSAIFMGHSVRGLFAEAGRPVPGGVHTAGVSLADSAPSFSLGQTARTGNSLAFVTACNHLSLNLNRFYVFCRTVSLAKTEFFGYNKRTHQKYPDPCRKRNPT